MSTAELKLIALLATSSATDGLYLEMQPIMSLTKPHESLNFEVLLRMRDLHQVHHNMGSSQHHVTH